MSDVVGSQIGGIDHISDDNVNLAPANPQFSRYPAPTTTFGGHGAYRCAVRNSDRKGTGLEGSQCPIAGPAPFWVGDDLPSRR